MNNSNIVIHTISRGDTLYSIARRYNTTIESIMDANPYLNPQGLTLGDKITIYKRQDTLKTNGITQNAFALMEMMRALWDDHIVWNRQYIVTIADNLRDITIVEQKLLANAAAIGSLFSKYYGNDMGGRITNILRQHILYESELIKALKRGEAMTVDNYDRELRRNADEMAFTLNNLNPYYAEENIRNLLYQHINFVRSIAITRFAKNYTAEADNFDKARDQGVKIADYFTNGIIEQYPNEFD